MSDPNPLRWYHGSPVSQAIWAKRRSFAHEERHHGISPGYSCRVQMAHTLPPPSAWMIRAHACRTNVAAIAPTRCGYE